MCLTKLANFECPNEGIGYKVFKRFMDEKLVGQYSHKEQNPYELNKEYTAIMQETVIFSDVKYTSGFHIFLSLEDAKDYIGDEWLECVYQVSYRNVLAKGIQGSCDEKCITAEFMTIDKCVYVDEAYEVIDYNEYYNDDDEEFDDDWDDWDDDDYDEEVEE